MAKRSRLLLTPTPIALAAPSLLAIASNGDRLGSALSGPTAPNPPM